MIGMMIVCYQIGGNVGGFWVYFSVVIVYGIGQYLVFVIIVIWFGGYKCFVVVQIVQILDIIVVVFVQMVYLVENMGFQGYLLWNEVKMLWLEVDVLFIRDYGGN